MQWLNNFVLTDFKFLPPNCFCVSCWSRDLCYLRESFLQLQTHYKSFGAQLTKHHSFI